MNKRQLINKMAEAAHEVNRAYCAGLGDNSSKVWNEASLHQQVSIVNGVENFIDNDGVVDLRQTHNNWMKFKIESGWRSGPEKDEKNMTHPCLVPYDSLPEWEKLKNTLFLSVLSGIWAKYKGVIDDE